MASTASIQKAAQSQALTVAKAALKGAGAVEAGSSGVKVSTASTATKKAAGGHAGVTLARSAVRKLRIRI